MRLIGASVDEAEKEKPPPKRGGLGECRYAKAVARAYRRRRAFWTKGFP